MCVTGLRASIDIWGVTSLKYFRLLEQADPK